MAAAMRLECRFLPAELAHAEAYFDAQSGVVPLPSRPSAAHQFDYAEKVWKDPRTLADMRDAQWEKIRSARDAQESTSFPYMGREIDSDLASVVRINTMTKDAERALVNQGQFVIAWTCADNSSLYLDAEGMIGMGTALAAYVRRLHAAGGALRARVYAETSSAALAAITWDPNV